MTGFAARLEEAGIKVWLDENELLPGESLTEQIFTQGLGGADVVVAVLSANSINSSWVREELHNAAIRRTGGKCKIVPIVLDDAEVPEFLIDTVHVKISNCSFHDNEFRRILNAIRETRTQPSAHRESPGKSADSSPAAIEAAVSADDITVRLRESVEELDDLLRNIPTPADGVGDDEANKAVLEWRDKAILAISFVETAIPNYPSRPVSDPALVALVEDMEEKADQAISELSEHNGVLGRLGHVTVTIGTRSLLEVRSSLGTVARCYEEHLWDRFSKRGIPTSS